jgi:hypothetical protein
LSNLLNHVPLSIWYDWKNDGTDAQENEHNFGTVGSDLEPKPAYIAARTLTHELAGYRVAGRQSVGTEQDYLLLCTNVLGAQKLVGWTLGQSHSLEVPLDARTRSVSGTRGDGESFPVRVESGHGVVPLSPSPTYLTLHSDP